MAWHLLVFCLIMVDYEYSFPHHFRDFQIFFQIHFHPPDTEQKMANVTNLFQKEIVKKFSGW